MDPVLEKLQDIEKALKNQTLASKRILNTEEMVAFFGIPKNQIYKLCSLRQIPHSKKNGLWFEREEIEKWLLSNPITTDAELQQRAASHILRNRR